jgi:hypothetical protein
MTFEFNLKAGVLTLLLLAVCCGAGAQVAPSAQRVEVTFPQEEMTISAAFRHIERQTPFRFAFTDDRLNVNTIAYLPARTYTVAAAVDRVLSGTGYGYSQRQNHFIIVPRTERQPLRVEPQQWQIDRIERRDVAGFLPETRRTPDSVYYRTVVEPEAEGFVLDVGDKSFWTPGKRMDGVAVSADFQTAERWQRSKFALKTNLVSDIAGLAPNLHAELGLGKRTTFEMGVAFNGWNLEGTPENNRKMIHGIASGEFRYWTCERFNGHFFGVHAFGGFYNVSGHDIPMLFEKEFRYEGTGFGAGISYGYVLPIATRWNVEFNVGVGMMSMKYDKFGCEKCNDLVGSFSKTTFAPTRLGATLVFVIK